MSRKQTLPMGAGCSNVHRRNPRRSKIPLFEEMTYAAMIGQSAEGFRVRQLVLRYKSRQPLGNYPFLYFNN
jgi:hypothetical protein